MSEPVSAQSVVAAIDIGTTSAKGLLVSTDGTVIFSSQKFYNTTFSDHGFAEQDPDLIVHSVFDILGEITKVVVPSGVCFSAAMHSIMAIDKDGLPLTKLIIWSDTRSKGQSKELIKNNLAHQLYEITGTPVHPMSPLCKLLWMKEEQPHLFKSAFKFISIKEYVLFRLTGEYLADQSIASASGLLDLSTKRWSTLALTLTGLKEESFSPIVPVNTVIRVKNEIVTTLRLANVPLVVGASDGCLAQWGSYALGEKDLSITIGTSGAVRVASSKRKIDPDGRIFNYILDENRFICGGATNSGTALLNWYSTQVDPLAGKDITEFVNQVMSIGPGCDGLVMIPFLLGERAPIYNPEVRGIFFGVSINHTNKHFQRAILEGICFQIRWIAECVEDLFEGRENILVSGGFTRAENWVQILCDVLGKTITLHEANDASAMGAALMGFNALKIQCQFTPTPAKVFHPDKNAHQIYSDSYRTYRELYSAVEKLF